MVKWTRDTPWRQGHLLDANAAKALELIHPDTPENTLVIVATHDCDLAQEPHGEPNVEVIVGRSIAVEEKDGNCTHAKTARKLHIQFGGDVPLLVEFEATGKATIGKTDLSAFTPRTDIRLSPQDFSTFQIWLASRYRRSAFPDEFERRLTKETKLAEKIAKAVKPHGDLITGVFFDVDGGEEVTRNGPEDTYTLDIIILHTAEPDFVTAEAAAVKAAAAIEVAFKDKLFNPTSVWQQIELRSCESISESVLSYQEFKQLKKWRLEHISLASDPQQSLLVE